jgi:hypothetical protein
VLSNIIKKDSRFLNVPIRNKIESEEIMRLNDLGESVDSNSISNTKS